MAKVIIDNLAYRRIMHWVDKSQYEVSGFFKYTLDSKGVFQVSNAILVPQVNKAAETDIKPADAAKAMYLLRDIPGMLGWWHSHVKMGVFWSGTDRATIAELGSGGEILSIVFNQKREILAAFHLEKPFPIFVDKIDTEIASGVADEVAAWDAEYKTNVKNVDYAVSSTPWDWDRNDDTKYPMILQKPPIADVADQEGFTDDERSWLNYCGLDDRTITGLLASDMTPDDLLDHYGYFEAGGPEANDDIPVADRRHLAQ